MSRKLNIVIVFSFVIFGSSLHDGFAQKLHLSGRLEADSIPKRFHLQEGQYVGGNMGKTPKNVKGSQKTKSTNIQKKSRVSQERFILETGSDVGAGKEFRSIHKMDSANFMNIKERKENINKGTEIEKDQNPSRIILQDGKFVGVRPSLKESERKNLPKK